MPKIMLVEDDNNLREIYGERLLAEGYEIVSASDGEEALALAVKEKPDLIISDVMMPKISGFDMLDILRQTPETKNTQVIMMTALSQSEDKERADKLGADKYLVKSQVTLEDVARVVHDMLYGPEPAAASEEVTPATTPALETPTVAMPMAVAPVTEPQAVVSAPEPVVTPPSPVAVEPVVAPAPEPVAAPVTPEPVSFVPPTPTPVAAPEPVTTAPEPPVAAPEPAAVVEPVAVEPPASAPAPAPEPVATPAVVEPVASPTPEISAEAAASEVAPQAQDLATEQADVEKQIESFINAEPVETAPHAEPLVEPTEAAPVVTETPAPEPEAATVIAPDAAVPTEPTAEPTTAPEEPLPANIPRPMDENVAESASVRKKVIEPISDPTTTPNINALYEKEMAAEAANTAIANPGTGAVIGGTAAAAEPAATEEPTDPNNAANFAL